MYVLGLDVETTGLSPDNDKIIELGAVVWDTKQNKPVAMINHLISIGEQPLRDKTTELTGITGSDLVDFGIDENQALEALLRLASKCDYLVAHNGNKFDKPFIDNALAKYGLTLNKPWIDSLYDVPYADITSRKLTNLAKQHNVSSQNAHRALFDVLMMLEVCANFNWQEIIDIQKSPSLTLIADVNKENRQLAKDAGFYFDRQELKWKKRMKRCLADKAKFSFGTSDLESSCYN